MAKKRMKTGVEMQELAQEQCLERLFGVLQVCLTKMAPETSMRVLGRLAASSKKLAGVVSAFKFVVAQSAFVSPVARLLRVL
jgi:hypothetical protein